MIKVSLEAGYHENVRGSVASNLPVCTSALSLVLEVVLESLRQWECVNVMDALSPQSQSGYPSAQVHEGEGLRCERQNTGDTWSGSKPYDFVYS